MKETALAFQTTGGHNFGTALKLVTDTICKGGQKETETETELKKWLLETNKLRHLRNVVFHFADLTIGATLATKILRTSKNLLSALKQYVEAEMPLTTLNN